MKTNLTNIPLEDLIVEIQRRGLSFSFSAAPSRMDESEKQSNNDQTDDQQPKIPNADALWKKLSTNWKISESIITIGQLKDFIPLGSAGVTNRSSYDFAVLTLLSSRRNYVRHLDKEAEDAINFNVNLVNRNNGIWRKYLQSRIERKLDLQSQAVDQHEGSDLL